MFPYKNAKQLIFLVKDRLFLDTALPLVLVLQPCFQAYDPIFCCSVCVDHIIWKSGKKWGRPGSIHHMS